MNRSFAHSRSFVLSNLSKWLTVAHLIRAKWVNERLVNDWMSKWANEQLANERIPSSERYSIFILYVIKQAYPDLTKTPVKQAKTLINCRIYKKVHLGVCTCFKQFGCTPPLMHSQAPFPSAFLMHLAKSPHLAFWTALKSVISTEEHWMNWITVTLKKDFKIMQKMLNKQLF